MLINNTDMTTYQQNYRYDASTNLLALRHTQNGTTQARTQPVRARNNRQRLYTYDEAGNQLSTDTLDQLCYGADGQICSIEWQQGGYKMREDYTYLQPGVRARKITRTWNAAGVLVGLETTTYIGQVEKRASYRGANLSYDGDTCIGYTTQHRWTVTRIKDGHGQVGTLTKNEETGEETVTYHALNHLDSNELAVDEAGNVIRYASYLPYGETQEVIEASDGKSSELGYSGQEQDATGLHYYGYRYLQGSSGLWNRADPIRFESGQLNLYGMLEGNPVRGRDERGLGPQQLMLALLQGYMREMSNNQLYEAAGGSLKHELLWRVLSLMFVENQDFKKLGFNQPAFPELIGRYVSDFFVEKGLGLYKFGWDLRDYKLEKEKPKNDKDYYRPQLPRKVLINMQKNHQMRFTRDSARVMLNIMKRLDIPNPDYWYWIRGKKKGTFVQRKLEDDLAEIIKTGKLDSQATKIFGVGKRKYYALHSEMIINALPEYLLRKGKPQSINKLMRQKILAEAEKMAGTLGVEFSDHIRRALIENDYAGTALKRKDDVFSQVKRRRGNILKNEEHYSYRFTKQDNVHKDYEPVHKVLLRLEPNDVVQEKSPFCHAYAGLSSLVQLNELFVRSVFVRITEESATLRFFNKGNEPVYITIDRTNVSGQFVDLDGKHLKMERFDQGVSHRRQWVRMIEKAWAVAGFTGFSTTMVKDEKIQKHLSKSGLFTPDGSVGSSKFMEVLMGQPELGYTLSLYEHGLKKKQKNNVKDFDFLRKYSQQGMILTTGFVPKFKFPIKIRRHGKMGSLVEAHRYSVYGIVGDSVLVRNPHDQNIPKQVSNGMGDMEKMKYQLDGKKDTSLNTQGLFVLSKAQFIKWARRITVHHLGAHEKLISFKGKQSKTKKTLLKNSITDLV
ncbi:RHS repeat-associated core domain-containing protein [uncultured Microscilla sp.]|uniref:RHS repeat domain-containing protein n=1 Tax=uncultured Microscilla sp. TaxID=432653 RepID=UPI002627C8DC|nr:RHS repeat-associated core domain-containing protein [uncultured Microscilla sp.]